MQMLKSIIWFVSLTLLLAGCENAQWVTADDTGGSEQERAIRTLIADLIHEAQEEGAEPDGIYSVYILDKLGAPSFRNIEFQEENGRIVCGEIAFGPFEERGTLKTTFMVLGDSVNIGTRDDRCAWAEDACIDLQEELSAQVKEIGDSLRARRSTGRAPLLQQQIDAARETIDSAATHCSIHKTGHLVDVHKTFVDTIEKLYGN